MSEATSIATESSPNVGVSLTVIANGVGPHGVLRATLLATPRRLRLGETTNPPISLASWPKDIVAYLDNLRKNSFPLIVRTNGQDLGPDKTKPEFVYLGQGENGLTEVRNLWRKATPANFPDPWNALLDDLDNSAKGDKLKPGQMDGSYPGDADKGDDNTFHEGGALQADPGSPTTAVVIGGVVANPQAQYAAETETARAQRVCAKLCAGLASVASSQVHPPSDALKPTGAVSKAAGALSAEQIAKAKKTAFRERFKQMIDNNKDSRARAADVYKNAGVKTLNLSGQVTPVGAPKKIPVFADAKFVRRADDRAQAKEDYSARAGHVYGAWPQWRRGERSGVLGAISEGRAIVDMGPSEDQLVQMHSAFLTLRGDALLSRLFGFTFDISFKLDTLADGQTLRLSDGHSNIWTEALYSSADKGHPHFWPAARPFGDANSGVPRNEQLHGVYDFDDTQHVTSIDVRGAVTDAPDGVDRGGLHQTLGFTFLDSVAADRAARDLGVANALQGRIGQEIVLYAEELTVGRRLDVRVGSGDWRSLMYRYVSYPDMSKDVAARLAHVAANFEQSKMDGKIQILEETSFQRLSRAIPVVGDENGVVESIVEDAYLTWGGGPLAALACQDGGASTGGPRVMPIARAYDLPKAEFGKRRPPPTRCGLPYSFGMRATFLGGGGPSLEEAVSQYSKGSRPTAVLPNDGKTALAKRFLRHEAIGAPVLLLPASLVSGKRKPDGKVGPMGYEAPAEAILRTDFVGDDEPAADPPGPAYIPARARASEASTFRVLVAPMAGMEFCARHGVFDSPNAKDWQKALMGGLLEVKFLHEIVADNEDPSINYHHTGFPVAKVSRKEGFNAEQLIYQREIAGVGLKDPEHDAVGGAVFESLKVADSKRDFGRGYVPDPAAKYISLRLRVAGSDAYLQGDLRVPLYDGANAAFPNATPVLVEVRKSRELRAREALASHAAEVVEWVDKKPARWRFDSNGAAPAQDGVLLQHVRVTLFCGEQFDIEATCLPDVGELADNFSLVETIGVQMTQAQGDQECAKLRTAACGAVAAQQLDHALGALSPSETVGVCNAPSCDSEGRRRIAQSLVDCIQTRWPLTEVAAPTTLRTAHAISAPIEAPKLWDVIVARTDTRRRSGRKSFAERKNCDPDGLPPLRFDNEENANGVVLSGEIEVDLEQIDAIEVNACVVSPNGKPFDDPARGRGLLARRAGRWPSAPGKEDKRDFYRKLAVFGFDVTPDGKSQLAAEKVTLLRVENLPDPRVALAMSQAEDERSPPIFLGACGRKVRLDLGALYLASSQIGVATSSSETNGARAMSIARPRDVSDTRARFLRLEVTGVSRFARRFETAPMFSADGQEHLLSRRRPLRATDQRKTDKIGVRAPSAATERPAVAGARTPQIYFRTERCALGGGETARHMLTRKCGVRLRFDRGWFSSGEGERLGIVLWPPCYLDQDTKALENNQVDWRRDGKLYSQLTLPDLMDADLGDGGPFVSRWGGDPVRGDLDPQKSWFIPPKAFACLDPAEVDECILDVKDAPPRAHSPCYVASARMPIEPSVGDPNANRQPHPSWLEVSLLTFEPYFDIEAEEWFVDVPLSCAQVSDPFIRFGLVRYQPSALNRDLQVSTPVRVWTQLPPRRYIVVTSQKSGDNLDVLAVVRGHASAAAKPLPVDAPATGDKIARPHMKLSVFHECEEEAQGRRQVQIGALAAPDGVLPQVKEGEFEWTMSACIETDNLVGLPKGRLVAWVEEIEFRLPATYPEEPVTLAAAYAQTATSGPRFLARVPFREHSAS